MSLVPPETSRTFAERHPVYKQFIERIKKPTKEQVVIPFAPAILVAIYSIIYGIADMKTLLVIILTALTLLIFYAAFAFVRAPFLVIKSQQQEITTLRQRLTNLLESPKAEPNLECKTMLAYVGQDDNGIFREDKNIGYQAAILEITNKAIKGRRVPAFEHVKARITFRERSNREVLSIHAGTWLREEYNFVPLRVGEWRKLIIALRELNAELLLAVQNEYENTFCTERLSFAKLINRQYLIDVEMVDTDGGEIINNFRFKLALNPYSPNLVITPIVPRALIEQLVTLKSDGKQILDTCVRENQELYQEIHEWWSRVYGFLLREFDEDTAWRIAKTAEKTPYPDPVSDGIRSFVDTINTQLTRLDEIIEKVRGLDDS